MKGELDNYRHLRLENGRVLKCPARLETFLQLCGPIQSYGDWELSLYAFPLAKYGTMDGLYADVHNHRSKEQKIKGMKAAQLAQQAFQQTVAATSLAVSDLLSSFLSTDLREIIVGEQILHWDNRHDPSVLYSQGDFINTTEQQLEAIEKACQDCNDPIFQSIQDPYELLLLSGETQLEEMRAIRWDGNEKFVLARGRTHWYYFRYCTS